MCVCVPCPEGCCPHDRVSIIYMCVSLAQKVAVCMPEVHFLKLLFVFFDPITIHFYSIKPVSPRCHHIYILCDGDAV